jgi:hypothetical protein
MTTTRDRQRSEAKKARVERRRQAVEWIAGGEKSQAEVARLLGVATRTVERWCVTSDFMRDVERVRWQRELDAHHNADRRWKRNDRAGYREAHDPGMRPEVAERRMPSAVEAEMAQTRAEILARQTREAASAPASDYRIIEWILCEAPRYTTQAEFLDYRDAEHGVASDHARRRYEGRLRAPQVRVHTIPTIAEAGGWNFG